MRRIRQAGIPTLGQGRGGFVSTQKMQGPSAAFADIRGIAGLFSSNLWIETGACAKRLPAMHGAGCSRDVGRNETGMMNEEI